MPRAIAKDLKRGTLTKYASPDAGKVELAQLRMAYTEDADLLSKYINKLVYVNRVYPKHNPIQASFRWSTTDPPITNWPRACINQSCQVRLREQFEQLAQYGYLQHAWTDQCWSLRDIFVADDDEYMLSHDHDDIEGRIYAIILNDKEAMRAYQDGLDRHTITYCRLFKRSFPRNLRNPHTSPEDAGWREANQWQGKDTPARVTSKNFNHGSKYTESPYFVYTIPNLDKYGIDKRYALELAKEYISSLGEVWTRKITMMRQIQMQQISRTLYGGRRLFYDSSPETGREGFSHMISGTVSHYNDITINLLNNLFGEDIRIMHNAHDGDKWGVKKARVEADYTNLDQFKQVMKGLIERPIMYQGRSLVMTAGVKVS
jgi:hypothetical protein